VGDEELLADVVVGADGIHTVVGRQAGLVSENIRTYLLGVKEVLDLPPEVIEDRFQLAQGKGICYEASGYPVEDILGAITLYTNKDSISLAVFGWVDQLKEKGVDLHQRLLQLKEHPYIKPLVRDAELREYQAHIISNGGRMDFSELYADGVLLCGEAGGFNDYAYIGVPPGMLSGMIAADTIEHARKNRDYSAGALSRYISLLESTGLARLLYNSRRASKYLSVKGKVNLPGYMEDTMGILENILEDEVTYSNSEPYPAGREFYFKVAENWVPEVLRRPVRAAIKALSPVGAAMRKRKMRKVMQ
jgi:electron transfer flavoprotein-quinone oxidoreductase